MTSKIVPLTLQDFKVDDFIGRKHINGVMVTQELYQVDMLNRMLVALCAERSEDKIFGFTRSLFADAQLYDTPWGTREKLEYDPRTGMALACACEIEVRHPVVSLCLLRLARIERMIMLHLQRQLPHQYRDRLEQIVTGHMDHGLDIGFYIDGQLAEGSDRKIFKLTEEELAKEEPGSAYWPFGEFLNLPYALEVGQPIFAQVIIGKCYSLKALEQLYTDVLLKDGYLALSEEIARQIDHWRYAYLFRQTQFASIELAGFTNVQDGLTRHEAQRFLMRDIHAMIPNRKSA